MQIGIFKEVIANTIENLVAGKSSDLKAIPNIVDIYLN